MGVKSIFGLLVPFFPPELCRTGFVKSSGGEGSGGFTQAGVKSLLGLVVSRLPSELCWTVFAGSIGGEGSGGFALTGVKKVWSLLVSLDFEGAVKRFTEGCSWATFIFLSFSGTCGFAGMTLVTTDPSEEFFFLKVNTL